MKYSILSLSLLLITGSVTFASDFQLKSPNGVEFSASGNSIKVALASSTKAYDIVCKQEGWDDIVIEVATSSLPMSVSTSELKNNDDVKKEACDAPASSSQEANPVGCDKHPEKCE
jgi:hypothetical protein